MTLHRGGQTALTIEFVALQTALKVDSITSLHNFMGKSCVWWLDGQLTTKGGCRTDKRTKEKLNKQLTGCLDAAEFPWNATKVTNRNGRLNSAQKWKASSINYDNYFASRAETRQRNNEARRKVQGNVREYVWIIAFYEAEHGIKTAKMNKRWTWGWISKEN